MSRPRVSWQAREHVAAAQRNAAFWADDAGRMYDLACAVEGERRQGCLELAAERQRLAARASKDARAAYALTYGD